MKIKLYVNKISSKLIIKLLSYHKVNKGDFSYYNYFEKWQKQGVNIFPNHFYQPIPDLSTLSKKDLAPKTKILGVKMREEEQLKLLKNIFPKFKKEYLKFTDQEVSLPYKFRFGNLAYDWIDALVYYCMIREFKPKRIIEIGSGWSTKIAAEAVLRNNNTTLTSIEPYPYDYLQRGFPGFTKLIKKKIQDVKLEIFEQLEANDILFIDSSHTVKAGGDVNHIFFEILPRLKKGIIIHFHDIFFTNDYPPNWITKEYRFWNEQYLLQAFLMYNDSFEVLFSNSYMTERYPKEIKKTFHNSQLKAGGFWMRKVKD